MNYREAVERLDNGIKKDTKKIANNTWLVRHAGYVGVRLHNTEVVEIYPTYYKLFTGGWFTVTTKSRINEYADNARITQSKGRWLMRDGSIFYEGVKVDTSGNVTHPKYLTITEDKKIKKLKASIAKYVKLCGDTFDKGMPVPGAGDCWYCCMRSEDGKTVGDNFKDTSHLLQHIKEGYIVPSLLLNAAIEAGYKYPMSFPLGGELGKDTMGGKDGMASAESVKLCVRKYLNKRLLPAGVIGKTDNHSTGYAVRSY